MGPLPKIITYQSINFPSATAIKDKPERLASKLCIATKQQCYDISTTALTHSIKKTKLM